MTTLEQFMDFLKSDPLALGRILQVLEAFRNAQLAVPPTTGGGAGPDTYTLGTSWATTTEPLDPVELQTLYDGYGHAVAKEKALSFIRGFFAGATVAGGGL